METEEGVAGMYGNCSDSSFFEDLSAKFLPIATKGVCVKQHPTTDSLQAATGLKKLISVMNYWDSYLQ